MRFDKVLINTIDNQIILKKTPFCFDMKNVDFKFNTKKTWL